MNKLDVQLVGKNEIHFTRTLDAPRKLIYKAMTSPELIKRWLGGKRAKVLSAEIDARVGGKYRYAFKPHGDYPEFAFVGVIKEISEERMVYTESFEGQPGESLVTTTWSEKNGKTFMKVVMHYDSPELRDMVVGTGMSDGAGESYDELEKLVGSL